MRRRSIVGLLLLGPVLFPATPGSGQNVTLDEGTFLVSMADGATGVETFTIRQAGGGPEARIIAQARIQWTLPSGERTVVPLLEVRSGGLFAYQVEVSGDTRQEIYLRAEGRRFVANVRSDAGEQQREFRARPGTVLLDRAVAHQYYVPTTGVIALVAAGLDLGPIPVLTPIAGEVAPFELSLAEPGTVRIGGRALESQRLVLVNGTDRREVWFDDEGRVLKVEVPALGYVAERETPPRG